MHFCERGACVRRRVPNSPNADCDHACIIVRGFRWHRVITPSSTAALPRHTAQDWLPAVITRRGENLLAKPSDARLKPGVFFFNAAKLLSLK
jgi:hypothetical protein